MFDHVDFHVSDLAASRAFYDEALGRATNDDIWVEWGDFGITTVSEEHPLTENLHVAFPAPDRQTVCDFHDAAVAAGYASAGSPGERAQYHRGYYAAYVLDPDGNNIEVVNHNRP